MSRHLLNALTAFTLLLTLSATALAADPQSKTGTVKSVDAKAKSFIVTTTARPLTFTTDDKTTFTTDDKTTFTLDGKASTFDNAVKADQNVTVTYSTSADEVRLASKVEVTTVPAIAPTK